MHVQPYLIFEGRAEEAIHFYTSALKAEVVQLMRFSENPEPANCAPGMPTPSADKVMHAALKIGESTVMLSDGQCAGGQGGGKPDFKGFSLTLDAADEATAQTLFAALGDGGNVVMPITKTFFSPAFGMVADRFGVTWMVIVN